MFPASALLNTGSSPFMLCQSTALGKTLGHILGEDDVSKAIENYQKGN
jgi:hypothetical protein